jgi:hypothetical protein
MTITARMSILRLRKTRMGVLKEVGACSLARRRKNHPVFNAGRIMTLVASD